MVPSAPLPPSSGSARLAEARERFLTSEPVARSDVREPILASWWRSRDWKVAADRVELSYVRDPNLDTPLTRNAVPVWCEPPANGSGAPWRKAKREPSSARGPRCSCRSPTSA